MRLSAILILSQGGHVRGTNAGNKQMSSMLETPAVLWTKETVTVLSLNQWSKFLASRQITKRGITITSPRLLHFIVYR